MITIEEVLRIAINAHEGQKDLDGKPVILHPLAVGLAGSNREQTIAGFLHDVVEDTAFTFDDMLEKGLDEEIVDALRLLTRDKSTDYYDYVQRIIDSGNPIALAVKRNDLTHNLARGRAGGHWKQVQKHEKALQMLNNNINKEEKYRLLTEQINALVEGETDGVAVMANVCAAIQETMGFFWTGFYRVVKDELILGPFQGPVACMHIPFGRGVCGTAWERRKTIVVPDVEQFPGHIACSSLSRSEIVVPVFSKKDEVIAVLDIDSKELATFDDTDRQYLEAICAILSDLCHTDFADYTDSCAQPSDTDSTDSCA